MSADKPTPKPTVRVKPYTYQPSKAELEKPVAVRKPDGSRFTPEEAARALLRPVDMVQDPDA